MDQIDREILDILDMNGRASFTEIAERVEVSEGTVRNRVENMMENGIIEGFTVEISPEKGVRAFVMIELQSGVKPEDVFENIEYTKIYELTGPYDAMAKLENESSEGLNRNIESIRSLEGVIETETYMILNQR